MKLSNMRLSIIVFTLLTLISCNRQEECVVLNFGEEITLTNETLVCIDGAEYTLIALDDRCCCGCTCVWEGQFVLDFLDSEENTVYSFQERMLEENLEPPFGTSMAIVEINDAGDCGGQVNIDQIKFSILINN